MTKEKALRSIDAPLYKYWQALYLSFFSSRLYVDVGKRWRGIGILYLLLLMFIITLPFALRVTLNFNQYFTDEIIEPLKKIPKLYVQNGKVSLDKPMPYLIKNNRGEVVSIIDTTGTVKSIDGTFPALSTLITKDEFIYRLPPPQFFFEQTAVQNTSPIYVQPLSTEMNEIFDGKQWVASSGIERARILSIVTLYPTIVLMFFVVYLAFFLAFAFMGQLVAKLFMKFNISYKQACRLLMVSATPQIVVLVVFLTLNWVFLGLGLLLILLLAGYFSFAVLSLKRESSKLVVS